MSTARKKTSIVLVDGCRIPFQKPGTAYRSYRAHDLARFVIRGLLDRTGLDPGKVDRVIMGSVIQDPQTANVAREAALGAGLPASVPAQTVSMSCLSGHLAITTGAEAILSGQAEVVIAGGAESVSAYFARYPLKRHPSLPYLTEFSTGESMGEYADRLAALYGVTRETQDAFTVRSHQSAVRAFREELHDGEIVPVTGPPDFVPVTRDNMVRPDTTPEALSLLKPAFNRKFGTVTAANASHYADGAAAVLLMSEAKADELGLEPLARLTSWVYSAGDPKNEMLLGQTSAIPMLLGDSLVPPADIDVFELQETFAAQIIAVLEAVSSEEPGGEKKQAVSIPLKKMNTLGGTLALGHAFGATGVRLVTTAANRLIREKGRYALVSSGAGGGLGHAMLLETAHAPEGETRTGSATASRTASNTGTGSASQSETRPKKKAAKAKKGAEKTAGTKPEEPVVAPSGKAASAEAGAELVKSAGPKSGSKSGSKSGQAASGSRSDSAPGSKSDTTSGSKPTSKKPKSKPKAK
ncbi:MAG: thiolase family protein [Balneolaceae bacterium]|nr:MAG: thiolase family protein [Balneolaceae bacterium]